MSRRCRASLIAGQGGTLTGGDLSSGCDCGRLAPGPGFPPFDCSEPLIYGSNVLIDPGIERQTVLYDPWNGGDSRPPIQQTSGVIVNWGSEEIPPYSSGYAIAQGSSNNGMSDLLPSSSDPDSGAFHLYAESTTATTSTRQSYRYIPFGTWICGHAHWGMTARVGPGDLVQFGMRAKADFTEAGIAKIQFRHAMLANQPGLPITRSGQWFEPLADDEHILTNAYQTILPKAYFGSVENSPTVSDAHWYWIEFALRKEVSAAAEQVGWYIDNMFCSVQQAGQNINLCSQSNLITIDNDTTETDFL